MSIAGIRHVTGSDEPAVIYVVRTSEAYRAALRGNPCELAAAIAHERIHVRQGRYQAPAYAEQLRVLRATSFR